MSENQNEESPLSRGGLPKLRANAERDYISGMPRHAFPRRPSMWVVAQLAEHRTVTAAREGSSPFDPPNYSHGTVAEG